jgi:hypothetical protein
MNQQIVKIMTKLMVKKINIMTNMTKEKTRYVQFKFNERFVSLFLNARVLAVFCCLLSCSSFMACQKKIQEISLSDKRLPAEARQKIADAQDAQIVARVRLDQALAQLQQAQEKQLRSLKLNLGSANSSFQQLCSAKVNLADLQVKLAQAELELSQKRLQLVYAQTAQRYDLAVYEIAGLEQEVEQLKTRFLSFRSQVQSSKTEWERTLNAWWTAYGQMGNQNQAYWSFE